MNGFVEQCRQEWTQLRVPEALADEMASELASDIREADADGITVEELLGEIASDPRAFAAAWAIERGIVPVGPRSRSGRRMLTAFTGLASVVVVLAAVLLATGEPKVSLVTHRTRPPHFLGGSATFVPPPGRVQASAAAPIEWILLCIATVALAFSVWLWRRWEHTRQPTPIAH